MKKNSIILILSLAAQFAFGQNDTTEWVSLQDGETRNRYKRVGDRIWCNNYKHIEIIDVETFKVHINSSYAKDKSNLYYLPVGCCYELDYEFDEDGYWIKCPVVPNVDPASFIVLKDGKGADFGTDKKNMYRGGVIIKDADIQSFEVLNEYYARDKNFIFYFAHKMKGADRETFRVFDAEVFKGGSADKYNLYRGREKYNDANPNEVRFLDFGYMADDKNVYLYRRLIEGLDGKTFQIVGKGNHSIYIKDKNGVYIGGGETKLEGSDGETFQYLSHGYSKDKNHVYYINQIAEGVDAETFQVLSCYYQKDKNLVYYWLRRSSGEERRTVENADPETFQLVGIEKTADNDYWRGSVAKDKNHVFLHLHIVEGADAETFELLEGNSNYRDKNHYYRNAGFVMQRKESK